MTPNKFKKIKISMISKTALDNRGLCLYGMQTVALLWSSELDTDHL